MLGFQRRNAILAAAACMEAERTSWSHKRQREYAKRGRLSVNRFRLWNARLRAATTMRFRQAALSFQPYSRTFAASLVVALLLATQTYGLADVAPKRVMMLHSFGPRFKPWSDYEQAIRSEINRQWRKPVDFLDHSLVNARRDDEYSEASFVEYLRTLYASRPVDLIVAIGAPSANFVQRYRQRLFPTTPMVFTAVEQRRVQYEKLTENDTVVAVAHDFPAAFENILRVLPLTKTIAIVNGASPNERFWLDEMRRELAPLAGRVELRWYDELSFEDILIDAARLPPHSAIFWHLMNVDAAGVAHETNEALNKLSSSASAPIFSYDGSFFGEAIVGGPMHSVLEFKAGSPLRLPFVSSTVKRRATSKPYPPGSQRPYSTGGKCSAGALAREICLPAAQSTSGSQQHGSGTRGRSRSSARSF